MSGLAEIIDWIQQEDLLETDSTPEREFFRISKIFENDSRLPLADILGDEQGEFFEYLENNIPRSKFLSSIDETISESESVLSKLERFISGLFK